jgi:phage tail sheath protein FI
MAVNVSYPGVYIEEVASGVRTITGVSTSITAFLGTAAQGPTDKAVRVLDLSDFTRRFGPLDPGYAMGYAVRDFFANGGAEAVICRLYVAAGNATGRAELSLGDGLGLVASSPGTWADGLLARVDHEVSAELAAEWGLTENDLFNLQVRLGPDGPLETFLNLTVKDSPRTIDRVLDSESALVRVEDPTTLPTTRPDKNEDPEDPDKPWEGDTPTKVTTKGKPSGDLTDATYAGDRDSRQGKYLLEDVDLVNLVCVLGSTPADVVSPTALADLLTYCVERRAFLIVDSPPDWGHEDLVSDPTGKVTALNLVGPDARNAALFYPRLRQADPARGGLVGTFAACGAVAGVMARTDGTRGVWKAPAGIDATVTGVLGLSDALTDKENGVLNKVAINALRTFPIFGSVVWGARTLRGADQAADEYKYVPIRRTALFLEESLYRGLKWVVFEPNDEPLWAQIRLNVGSFMQSLFRQGAFQGTTPAEAYFVKCDKETTTQDDRNKGIVNIVVGFAPLKPAEFVVVKIQQLAGQLEA